MTGKGKNNRPKSSPTAAQSGAAKGSRLQSLGQWHEKEGKGLLAVLTPIVAIVGLGTSLVSCHISSKATSQSDERVAITVNRIYGNERIDKSYGFPLIMSRWAVDINNLSSNPVSVLPPFAMGLSDQDMASSLGPVKPGQEPEKPIFIPARGSFRVEVNVPIPMEESSRPLTAQRDWPTFEMWRSFAKDHGLDDIGAPIADRRNAAAQIVVQSVEGRQYFGIGLWYPGIAPPTYKSR